MALRPEQIKDIAGLARLAVDDHGCALYAAELAPVLDLVERMNRLDTDAVEPLAHPLDMAQRLRADEPFVADQRERLQRGAPALGDGLYLVPRVLE